MEVFIFYLLKSAGILAIFFLSYHLLLKKETFFTINRHYLLAGILASLLLPLVVFTNYVYIEPEPFNPIWLLADIPTTTSTVQEVEPFNWLKFTISVYTIGVLVFAVGFIFQLLSLYMLITKNGIKKVNGFNFVETDGNISPFSFFKYIIYNPKKYNQEDLDIILDHEKAHGNQLHSADILVANLFLILQWFNPLAWLYKKSIQQNLEFMADKKAISNAECSKHYQHTLLKASLKPQYASITNNFYNSLIKKRIVMLNQSKSTIKNAWKYFIIFPALALFLMSFNVKTIEVVKEPESKDIKTTSDFSFTIEDNLLTNKEEPKSTSKTKVFTDKIIEPEVAFSQKIIEAKITKNTTDQQLKEIKESLKKDGIEFNYKNVKRNAQNEITGINVTYKDKDGNTGNYALSSDSPINTFYFFKNDDGSVGFKSENMHPEHRLKWVEAREMDKEKRKALIEERKRFMEEHKAEMLEERERFMNEHKEEMKERKKELEIRMKEARKEHEEKRKYFIKERIKLQDSLKNKHGNIFIYDSDEHDSDVKLFTAKNKPLYIVNGKESDGGSVRLLSPNHIEKVEVLKGENAINIYGDKGKDGVVVIKTKKSGSPWEVEYGVTKVEVYDDENNQIFLDSNKKTLGKFNVNIIKGKTTDFELKQIKSNLKNQNIDFKYSKLKRNKDGLITRIKVSLSNNNGNKSSSTFDSGNKGISPIILETNNNNLSINQIN